MRERQTLGEDIHIEKPFECLRCNHVLDMAAQADDDGSHPGPGSAMLCFECGYVMVLDKDSEPRAPSRRELSEMQSESTIVIALMSICKVQKEQIDQLKRESEANAKRAKTVSGGSPPGDQADGSAKSLPLGVSGTDGVWQDAGGGDDR